MRDSEAKALGLRAVACPGWRWLPGMLLGPTSTHRVCDVSSGEHGVILAAFSSGSYPLMVGSIGPIGDDVWPDLRDAATMGAALAVWQARPGHVFKCPCPVLTAAAVYGLTDRRTILALVEAMEVDPACVAP